MPARTRRLIQSVQELSLAESVEDVQRIVRSAARELAGSDGATFVLRDGPYCFYADEDAISPLWKGFRFPLETCISGWAMLHAKSVAIPDIYLDDRVPHEAYRPTFVKSLLMVPIRQMDPIGAIGNYWAAEHTVTEEEVALLQALADSTSVALERVAIREELADTRRYATHDALTGLANRRGFELLAGQSLDRVRRLGVDAALLFIDLDGLKEVNDVRGHAAGDELLVRMGQSLRIAFREEDVIARLGGDEFVVMVLGPGLRVETAVTRLRTAMRSLDEVGRAPLSASIGTARYEPGMSVDDLVALADAQMYAEKVAQRLPAPRRVDDAPLITGTGASTVS